MKSLDKPPHGSPCNGCGHCCEDQLCPLAMGVFFGDVLADAADGPCPALEKDGERRVCGLVATPVAYNLVGVIQHGEQVLRDAALLLIGSGIGCDAQLAGEPRNHEFVRRMDKRREEIADDAAPLALMVWGC